MKKNVLLAFAIGLLALQHAQAFNPQPDPPGYGMIGITPGQTLRLNVANVPLASPGVPPDPCRVELTFVDSAGNSLLPAVQTTLMPGRSTHLDFTPNPLPVNGDATTPPVFLRTEIRPVIHILPNPTAASIALIPPGPCVSTIEILDNASGKTLVTSGPQHPGAIYEFNPQPDPPKTFGITTLAPGQTARLTAVNAANPKNPSVPPDPCRVTLAFFDADGNVVAKNSEILKPGQAALLDVPRPALVNPPADAVLAPVQLRGVVTVENVNLRQIPPPCHTSFEVFDQATGQTAAVLSPQHVPLTSRSEAN